MASLPDPEKLRRKIQFVRDSLAHLEKIRDEGQKEFLSSHVLQAAATRDLQVAIEAILDSSNHIIAREGLGIPKTYRESILILTEAEILPKEKEDNFSRMVSFRNRAVHLYDEIDANEIFRILESHLEDFEIFIGSITRKYFQ